MQPLQSGGTIAIDGSVYMKYPGYPQLLERSLQLQLGPAAAAVRLVPATDGSGLGAAIIAALAGSAAARL
jgi:hexokinase